MQIRFENSMAATPQLCGIVNECKTVQVAGNGVTLCVFFFVFFLPGEIMHFSGSGLIITLEGAGTPRKKLTKLSHIYMTHSAEPSGSS